MYSDVAQKTLYLVSIQGVSKYMDEWGDSLVDSNKKIPINMGGH